MNTSSQRIFYLVRAAICCVFVLGCKGPDQRIDMERRMEKMKTVCVGRFLIDIPQNAIVSYRGASLSGWDISSWIESDEKFFARSTKEETELNDERNEKGGVSLEQIRELKNDHLQGRIFVFNRKWLEMFPRGVRTESQVVAIRAYVRIQDVTYRFYSKIRFDTDVDELQKIIGQLRVRGADEIPTQAGFCFKRALLVEPLDADQSEYTAMFVGLKDHPDLAIALSTTAGIVPTKSLLQRDAENSVKIEYRSRFHTLRKGPRALNGIPGEEFMERVDEHNGSVLHDFMWESLNNKHDVYLPFLTFELNTGNGKPGSPVNSSLSDPEVLALWEKMTNSLRVRPISASTSTDRE
ncbi:T6SS immunity protein Tli4 family protein [Duganella sp. BuS-21]|uniref:T6SS immunity protein Tli4 family protein n=1 Tax=Duganella sp. BuS-21 TaxID=2943848 RepID=UPI0035A5AABE